MLQIKNLSIFMTKDLRTIVKDLTFTLNPGDKAIIIGEEGNGKSTLLKLIFDARLVESYAEFEGEIFTGQSRLGYLSQELSPKEAAMSVYDYFQEVPGFFERTPKELSAIAGQLRFSFELMYSDRLFSSFSGGEKVKLRMAALMVSEPDILLLDEPSNDIDIETLEWLEHFINTCGLPVLFVSHDETLIENTANVIIHIENVRKKTLARHTIARMPYRQYAQERLSKLAHQEQVARKQAEEFEKQQEKLRHVYERVHHEQNVITRADPGGGRLLKKKMKSVKSMEHRFDREREEMAEIPDVEDAIVPKFAEGISVPNGKTVLALSTEKLSAGGNLLAENIELVVTGSKKICITGKNGTGKTTLMRIIANELLERTDIKAAYMPQDYCEKLPMNETPVNFLAPGGTKEEITRARTFLGSMKYTAEETEHSIAALSGGQKAKLIFLKMILEECNVLLLDEPTRNFSPVSNPVIRSILKSFGGTIIAVSHDRKFIDEVCDEIFDMNKFSIR